MSTSASEGVSLILASASPRRRELLHGIVSDFVVVPSRCAEPSDGPPRDRVLVAARAKAAEVAARCSGVVIGADTLVVADDGVLGKPGSREQARRMIQTLSGREHAVLTGLCVISTWTGEGLEAIEETRVRFRELTADEIERYVASGEADDKAGAYAIQGRAAVFIESICGDFYNVMGLPLCRLVLMLREVGVRV